ncbi:hypothetical protein KFL_003540110 [Klebsormidium nitens]|uniref:SPARK domain-containing protein n=1 Tax=Klebsormidium nitens TaxID=105231 RepID=A0A1Y1IH38_KLENI|nr:hypothetical protein KFL_003540110 [Klebsormidium nitens]|eukprot:GAQ87458.1 hypothetical protein KFL_003540110 [Klebsormidium nitens]
MASLCALLLLTVSPALASARALQQAPPGQLPGTNLPLLGAPPVPGVVAPGPAAVTIMAGTCPGVSFNATGLGQVAATCLGTNHPISCCLAVNQLWDSAALESPAAAQTLGQAYVDPDVEQDCLAVTAQALQGLGLHSALVGLCARGFTLPPTLQRGPNRCPSVDVSAPLIQNVVSACQSAQTPNDACGPCFNAIAQSAVTLLGNAVNATQAVAQAQGVPIAAAGVALAGGALQAAADCVQLVKLRVLESNPGVYRAFALQDVVSNVGCRPLVGEKVERFRFGGW